MLRTACEITDTDTGLGILLTLLGAAWYAKVEMTERQPAIKPTAEELEEGLGAGK